MATVKPQYLAFNAGEFDANTLARADLENYPRGGEIFENVLVYVQGRMEKAPGTRFIADVTNAARIQDEAGDDLLDEASAEVLTEGDSETVLRPFVFDETTKLVLEFTENRIRILSGTGFVQSGGADATLGAWSDESAATGPGGGAAPDIDVSEFNVPYQLSGVGRTLPGL